MEKNRQIEGKIQKSSNCLKKREIDGKNRQN